MYDYTTALFDVLVFSIYSSSAIWYPWFDPFYGVRHAIVKCLWVWRFFCQQKRFFFLDLLWWFATRGFLAL